MIKAYITISIITIFMIAAVVYGFTQVESPFSANDRKGDEAKVNIIRSIQYSMDNYYRTNNKLPENLSEVKITDLNRSYGELNALSPGSTAEKTNNDNPQIPGIEYKVVSKTEYQLCANFKTETKETSYNYYDKTFHHKSGHHCFDLEISEYVVTEAQNQLLKKSPTPQPIYQTPAPVSSVPICTDPDETLSTQYETASTVTYTAQNGVKQVYQDRCFDNNGIWLEEATCQTLSQGGFKASYISYSCPKGCSNGACIK